MTSAWLAQHVAIVCIGADNQSPQITAAHVAPILADHDLWDMWPLALADGAPARSSGGGALWMILSAPHDPDPDLRHD